VVVPTYRRSDRIARLIGALEAQTLDSSRFEVLVVDNGSDDDTAEVLEAEFKEKPRLPDHLINAGFFVFDREVFDRWPGEDLERDVLPALGHEGRLYAYRHQGFWKSMDTYKDAVDLSALCAHGPGPWLDAPAPAAVPSPR